MSLWFRRGFAIRPAVPTAVSHQPRNVEKNIPVNKRVKAWERDGKPKDVWFREKYAHIHAEQKQRRVKSTSEKRDAYEQRVRSVRQSQRDSVREHKRAYGDRVNVARFATNPLSEYLYGANPILAALQSDKRQYFTRLLFHETGAKDKNKEAILKLCKQKGIKIQRVDKHDLNLITKSAVHNNMAMECKPLDIPEIRALQEVSTEELQFQVQETDGFSQWTRDVPFRTSTTKKNPVGLYLDEVVDPHNMGAIIRSAYFLGADFIALSRRNCAPLSPVVAKTSSGALEFMPIFNIDKPLNFFEQSQQHGWTIVTSSLGSSHYPNQRHLALDDLAGLTSEVPVLLVMGNEANGVRANLRNRSDFLVEIPAPQDLSSTVESLNVSVATGILLSKLV